MTTRIRRVTIVAPMLNEGAFVDDLVADIAAQDYDGDLRVVVADGGSTDGSVDRLYGAALLHGVDVEVVPNPGRLVSPGLNACLERADGELIVRLDCHARYPADYIRLCCEAAEETGAWNVGGIVVANGRTEGERAVACAMSSAFGGIGWTRHGGTDERIEVDTVTYGAFRRAAFDAAGTFDTTLVRNQDDEFNLRLRRAGGRIVLDPRIRVEYTPRGTLRAVFRQYFQYGFWKIPVMRKHRQVLSLRSLAPGAFLLSFVALAVASLVRPEAAVILAAEITAYLAGCCVFGIAAVRGRSEPLRLAIRTAPVFPAFHFGYGCGMLVALARRQPT